MEKILSVHVNGLLPLAEKQGNNFSTTGFRIGTIEQIIEPGRYAVVMDNGVRVTAEGPKVLTLGDPVRVFSHPPRASEMSRPNELPNLPLETGNLWSALLPLGFGGKGASIRLEAFVESKMRGGLQKKLRAVYFVIWTRTEKLGDLQWSIYLKGNQVSLQVFAEPVASGQELLKNLTEGVERGLKKLGFTMLAPTIYLERPFKVPDGFRLNIEG